MCACACVSVVVVVLWCVCTCVCVWGGGAWQSNEFDSCHLIAVMRVAVVAGGAGARGELGFLL